jgi:uracil-DNA glycosylase family 4
LVAADSHILQQQAILAEMGVDVWIRRAPPDIQPTTVLLDLNKEILTCTRCELHKTRTQAVCGVGDLTADILVVGEAPGADEDIQGEPFVGRAGQLLNEMLRAMGHERSSVFIANVLKCRPPQNRDPAAGEVASCMPFLQRQIALLNPRLILVVGRIAAQSLLEVDTPIGKLRGRVHRYGEKQIPLVVTYHPAYLLRSPGQKRHSWSDLLLALDVLTNPPQ